MLIDTHAHIYLEDFKNDRDEVIKRAVSAGVNRVFLPNIDNATVVPLLDVCKKYPGTCFPLMGLHPCSVKENYREELAEVEKNLAGGKFYGVGEIGLDFYWDKTFINEQVDAFKIQCDVAKRYSLPVIIHSRASLHKIIEILEALHDPSIFGIFHCFPGTYEDAARILSLGNFKFGIGGVITYKNSALPDVVRKIGIEHIVLETDSPYLTPVPYRGKRNESAYLVLVINKVAEVLNMPVDEVARITTKNGDDIFG
ncbi:MAG: TatD family hydrolase [Bacteroidetes bacterium]|nr:TatD family hydrolase [Bacteroidota bacterium]